MSKEISDFDSLLSKLNDFGKYQKLNLCLMCLTALLTGMASLSFVFVAGIPEYRCRIPLCDNEIVTEYIPEWLENVAPFKNGFPKYCSRYELKNETFIDNYLNVSCPVDNFSKDKIIECDVDDLVFPDRHTTIANDLQILCENNQWKLSLVGTFSSLGIILGGPICGYISDRYGRKKVLVITGVLTSVFGILKSFSTVLEEYIILDLLETIAGFTLYSTAFIIGLELVGPSYRLLAATTNNVCLSVGRILLGVAAWYFNSWRTFLKVLYLPGLLIVFYWFLIPESIKWLISKKKYDEIRTTLSKISKINKRPLPENYEIFLKSEENSKSTEEANFSKLLRNRTLCLRFINCCILFLGNNIIFFGLSLNSVTLTGHKYINFIIISMVEIPGNILCAISLNRFSRRLTLGVSYLVTGICCILLYFISEGDYVKVIIYTIGKLMATIASNTMFIFITEVFPTSVRHSTLNICYAFGGIGSMLAPQTPLLAFIWDPLPVFTFGFFAILVSFLTIFFPETYNRELPDTIEESANISKTTVTKL
ncbi:organic cation transporter protein-like [Chrysoperla carnea]|uniref:organic cation transporter protein-like n=1 Tax=Chrysoperla carnea TaxID=189513 RepID=UPI001D089938|nr:organic cation transporter protein-like [Chrysoperla carnea]